MDGWMDGSIERGREGGKGKRRIEGGRERGKEGRNS